jgi:hypothetical protein
MAEMNLFYPVEEEVLARTRRLVDDMRAGKTLADVLAEAGTNSRQPFPGNGRRLLVCYTDLEPDDVLSLAQQRQWMLERGDLAGDPLIIFCVDLVSKDGGTILEKKLLMASLALGVDEVLSLSKEGDTGDGKFWDSTVHPKNAALVKARDATLDAICRKLTQFDGDQVEFRIMAPGHGNIGALVARLRSLGAWPLRPRWRVSMYTGSFNMRGMQEADLSALRAIMECTGGEPLVDLSKFPFFGKDQCLPVTASIATFATPNFARRLCETAPVLAAIFKLFNEEFNVGLVHPQNSKLFQTGATLDEDEKQRFKEMERVFFADGVEAYAKALYADSSLWAKVASHKKSTAKAFACGSCDGPLCDQLLFLFEWLSHTQPSWLAHSEPGTWCMDPKSGFTTISASATDKGALGILAVQPVLATPQDAKVMGDLRRILEEYFLKQLDGATERISRPCCTTL